MNTRPSPLRLYLAGSVITLLLAAITYLSSRFEYGSPMLERPIVFFVALLVVAGALYVFAVSTIAAITPSNKILFGVLFIGLIMRGALFFSTPILEDDYYRYLWDGALTANGYNPYAYTPNDINYYTGDRKIPSELSTLADKSGTIAYRINHGDLGTVYPPVAQASFAVAHVLNPWGLNAWKFVLLVCDVVTLLLLLGVLRKTGLPENRILIYWWNPLLIKEIYNSAHMDPVIMVFIAIALYCAVHQYTLRTGLALAAAIGTKIWPVLLVPLFLRYTRALKPDRWRALVVSTAFLTLLCIPMLWAIPLGEKSGLIAYSERWEMNDALFMVFDKITHLALSPLKIPEVRIDSLVRLIVGAILLLWIYFLTRNHEPEAEDFFNRLTLATAALFMLSPTQFPWYYLWILPLLTLAPRNSLLLLTPMLPLYYLKFYFAAHDQIDIFHNVIVWIEYTPTLIFFLHEAYTSKLNLRPTLKLDIGE